MSWFHPGHLHDLRHKPGPLTSRCPSVSTWATVFSIDINCGRTTNPDIPLAGHLGLEVTMSPCVCSCSLYPPASHHCHISSFTYLQSALTNQLHFPISLQHTSSSPFLHLMNIAHVVPSQGPGVALGCGIFRFFAMYFENILSNFFCVICSILVHEEI